MVLFDHNRMVVVVCPTLTHTLAIPLTRTHSTQILLFNFSSFRSSCLLCQNGIVIAMVCRYRLVDLIAFVLKATFCLIATPKSFLFSIILQLLLLVFSWCHDSRHHSYTHIIRVDLFFSKLVRSFRQKYCNIFDRLHIHSLQNQNTPSGDAATSDNFDNIEIFLVGFCCCCCLLCFYHTNDTFQNAPVAVIASTCEFPKLLT